MSKQKKTAAPAATDIAPAPMVIAPVITTSTVTLQADKFLEVEIDGTIYKLAIVQ